jgi:hypothetical protein
MTEVTSSKLAPPDAIPTSASSPRKSLIKLLDFYLLLKSSAELLAELFCIKVKRGNLSDYASN